MFRIYACLTFLVCLFACDFVIAEQPAQSDSKTIRGIPYRNETPEIASACQLDLFVPANSQFATVVWFHGGGLTSGRRDLPSGLIDRGIAVVGVDYRLSPTVSVAGCIDDAAASVAWTLANISKYGGDPDQVFVSGHSAGGYLTMMLGLDSSYLDKYDVDATDLAGLAPLSGHTITHFTQRKSIGLSNTDVLVDDMAPLSHVRSDAPPMLLITGDREREMLGRYEENAYFARMMKVVSAKAGVQPDVTLYELDGFDHSGMVSPSLPLVVKWIREHAKNKNN